MADKFNSRVGIINDKTPIAQTYGGGYVLPYVSPDLKWYERDSLVTYIYQLRYQEFAKDKDTWKIVNFNLIYHFCRDNLYKLDKQVKEYQTVTCADLESYPEKNKNSAVSST